MVKILVAEDDKFLLSVYGAKFTKLGYEIKMVKDGEGAITALKTFLPDLILLDLVMPVKDGFVVLDELSQNPQWSKIPVIVASNLGQDEDIRKAMKYGVKDFIIKSDTPIEQVVEKIQKVIG